MPRGGYRPGSGRKPGSGDPFKLHARNETEVIRAAREELTNKVVGTSADPLAVLIMIGADASQPAMTRIVAARSALPYIYSAQPTVAHVEHVHTTADANILMNALMARFERLTPAPVIDIEPTEASQPARHLCNK